MHLKNLKINRLLCLIIPNLLLSKASRNNLNKDIMKKMMISKNSSNLKFNKKISFSRPLIKIKRKLHLRKVANTKRMPQMMTMRVRRKFSSMLLRVRKKIRKFTVLTKKIPLHLLNRKNNNKSPKLKLKSKNQGRVEILMMKMTLRRMIEVHHLNLLRNQNLQREIENLKWKKESKLKLRKRNRETM